MFALAVLFLQDVEFSGDADLRYVHRDRGIERAAQTLERFGTPLGSPGDAGFFYHRTALRLDVRGPDSFVFHVAVETATLDDGESLRLGRRNFEPPHGGLTLAREAYAGWGDPATDETAARFGFQGLRFQNRPPGIGEPFFFDLSESESAWAGTTFPGVPTPAPPHSTVAVRNTAARDFLDFGGGRFHYAPNAFVAFEGFALTTAGLQSRDAEEFVAGLYANVALFESASVFLTGVYQHGPYAGADIGTVGLGVDGFLDEGRTLELYAEAYAQFGSLIDHKGVDVDKAGAYAWNAGARKYFEEIWIEASLWWLSGDARPTDGDDNAFQSHEDVDQFLILESNDFGLDFDTNYRAAKIAIGHGLAGDEVVARLDAGYFELDEPLVGPFGASPTRSRDLGVEVDATVTWRAHENVDLMLRAGALFSSNVLDGLSGESDAFLVTIGPRFTF